MQGNCRRASNMARQAGGETEAMEMVERCRGCRQSAKHIYWNHKTARFVWRMSDNSSRRLIIPENFILNFRGHLFDIVKLRGPSSHIWNVECKGTEDSMLFENGWREFAEDHSLAASDLLIFTYSGDSQFDALIFDKNGVEKVSSYFIKKYKDENGRDTRWHQTRKKTKEFTRPSHALPTSSEDNTTLEESETEYKEEQQNRRDPHPQCTEYVLKTRGNRQNLMVGKTFNRDRLDVEHGKSLYTTSEESETEYEKKQRLKRGPQCADYVLKTRGKRQKSMVGKIFNRDKQNFRHGKSLYPTLEDPETENEKEKQAERDLEYSDYIMKNRGKRKLRAAKTLNPDRQNVECSKSLYTTLQDCESEYKEKPQINRNSQYVLKTRDKRKNLVVRKPFNPDGRDDRHGKSPYALSEECESESEEKSQIIRNAQHVLNSGGKRKKPNAGLIKKFCDVKQEKVMTPPDGWKTYLVHFISQRRPVTEQEKDRALRLALSFETANPSFTAIMQPTHVSRRFAMTIPADFVREQLPKKSQLVEVRNANGGKWHVFYEHREKGTSAFTVGWLDFVFGNNLEVADACVFELSWERRQITFHVHIFRVVEHTVPLTRLTRKDRVRKQSRKAT